MIEYETKNWLATIVRLRGTVVPRIIGRSIAVAVVTVVLLLLHEQTDLEIHIPATAHAMVGVALGLLLVFRTNASYARYWEGRSLLGRMINNCRDLARQSVTFVPSLSETERREIADEIMAFAAVTSAYLREEPCGEAAEPHVGADRRRELEGLVAPPLRVIRWISERFNRAADAGRLPEPRLRTLDTGLSDLIDQWGGCEQIFRTPVPFAYAHHIKVFLTIFCFTAPLTMVDNMGWFAPVAAAVVAFGLYGIDEIGVEIEDPFGRDANDLPIDELLETLRQSVQETMVTPDGATTETPPRQEAPLAR
jgi:putative membrane protein